MPQQSTFGEAEKKAAERYKWWVVYLMREKRRLAGIAQAVQAGAAAQAEPGLPTPEVLPGESAEDFLMRVEQEREAILPDPLSLFEDMGGANQDAAKIAPFVGAEDPKVVNDTVLPNEEKIAAHPLSQMRIATQSPRGSVLQSNGNELTENDLLTPEKAVEEAFHNQPDDEQVTIEDL